jgi:uncharacterized membrane protein YeaQ/YmgE (transglycosylase-associated protein family)
MVLTTLVLGAAFTTSHWWVWLIVGLIAGFLATRFVKIPFPHFGIIGIIVVGLVGAFLAGLVIDLLLPNTTLGFFATILAAFLGAVVLLAIVHFIAGFAGRSRTSS